MYIQEPISELIWDLKYRYRLDGQIIDHTIEATWRRVAKAIAQSETRFQQKAWEADFYRILEDYRFLPGGRILAGSGTKHRVTLLNCFVMNIAEDSLKGIFKAVEEGALTLQQGGGVGYDFSVLRPQGDLAHHSGNPASGPVSFMHIWDAMCGVLLSTGARRGAMMGVLRCDHPDIEAFIDAKRDPQTFRHFNVSVLVTDAFMQAVKENASWPLIFPVQNEKIPARIYRYINARALWEKIIRSAYDYAEPGVLFADTINRMNNLWYRETITATNPCGEIPLPAYGACDLGAINLTQFVESPFSQAAGVKWAALEETVRIATRFLDNVLDVSHYPLKMQKQQSLGTRRIGLGVTGLADMFVMLNIRYGSDASIALAKTLMQKIATVTWQTSIELAQEKGVFPFYDKKYLQGQFVDTLEDNLKRTLAKYGVRNSHHNTIAPTGTTSLLANNVSNGIEPIFQGVYKRHMHNIENEILTFQVKDYVYHYWQHLHPHEKLPEAWIDAHSLSPDAHLTIQGAMQPYIDNAISKTINIPTEFPFDALQGVYSKAYALGLKGCTIYRPNPIRGSVLEVIPPEDLAVDHCCQFE